MKVGVSTSLCRVVKRPARARESAAVASRVNSSLIAVSIDERFASLECGLTAGQVIEHARGHAAARNPHRIAVVLPIPLAIGWIILTFGLAFGDFRLAQWLDQSFAFARALRFQGDHVARLIGNGR